MNKRIVVPYQYQAINFNEELESLVNTMVETRIKGEDLSRKLETVQNRLYVQSTDCEQYAERAWEILSERFPRYEFAAYSDASTPIPNSCWRLLAFTKSGKAISKDPMDKIRKAAKRILANIEAKHPEYGVEHRQQIKNRRGRSGLWGAIQDIFDP